MHKCFCRDDRIYSLGNACSGGSYIFRGQFGVEEEVGGGSGSVEITSVFRNCRCAQGNRVSKQFQEIRWHACPRKAVLEPL